MSNRQSVLASLKKHGQSTYEDLEFGTGIDRAQLRQAVNDAKKAGHILAGKDDITGQPAYTITTAGEAWLKHMPQTVATGEGKGKATVKESLTVEKPKAINLDERIKTLETDLAAVVTERNLAEINLANSQRFFHAAIGDLARINEALALDPDDGGADPILSAIEELRERITQLEELKVAEVTSKQPAGFIVAAPKQPMRRFKNNDTAKAQALSFARNFGTGEVFAIYAAGKAVRGAEWREAS